MKKKTIVSSHVTRCPNRRRNRRRGYILSTMLIFILPLLLAVGLGLMQLSLLKTAQQRVHAAAAAAADSACDPIDLDSEATIIAETEDAFDAAGLVLCHLAGDFRTEVEYFNTNGDPDNIADEVQVGVTIPMSAASTNYIGLLCGANTANDATSEARIRAVVRKTIPPP